MPVDLNSRYADGHFENFYQNPRTINSSYTGVRRASTPLLLRQPLPKYYVDSVYQWTAGDRWDTVAQRLGIPKTDWWRILDVNPQIEFPTNVRPGDYINVPVVTRRVI